VPALPSLRRLLREPIVHFLVGGAIVFGFLSWQSSDLATETQPDSRRIVVEREALLAFVQAKTKVADEAEIRRVLLEFDSQSRQEWIDRYVREEVLVREARALGLDREDPIIRRRLAQKIEFLTLGLLEQELRLDEAEIEAFYREHRADYRVPTTLTMTHVYVELVDPRNSGETSGPVVVAGRLRAEALLATLNAEAVSFRDAIGLGDRFLYNRNYVDRTIDEIRSHFGDAISDAMERVVPDPSLWRGPYRSEFGWHLILLTDRADSRVPALADIAPMLRDDALREKRETVLRDSIAALISGYQVDQTSVDTWKADSDRVLSSASESPAP
jgi:hypothetical protein